MKKSNLFLVILMALIVMSCSKDETTMSIPQESNAIEFGTYVGRDAQTRATMINTDAQLQAKGFGVFAYYTDNGDYNNSTTPFSKPNFMYNQFVEWDSSLNSGSGAWKYSPVKYWPNEYGSNNHQNNQDKLSFFAYAPYSATDVVDNFVFTPAKDGAGDPTITYTVNALAKSQEDLLWGVATDGFPFKNKQKQSINGNIKFTFKHALARIGFNVEAMVDIVNGTGTGNPDVSPETGNGAIDDKTKIVVTKVELIGNFYASGALNLNNTAANVPLWDGVPADPAERTFILEAGSTEGTSVNFVSQSKKGTSGNETLGQLVTNAKAKLNADDSYLMVIPQEFALADGIKIKVTYDVITEDINLNTGQSKVTNVITSTPFAFDFVGGKAYTFNLHLGMTSVKFDADVTEWADGGETVVNVPINN